MDRPLTIAVLAGNSVGGTEKAAALFAGELVRRGHRVFFLSEAGPRDGILTAGNVTRVDRPADSAAWARWLDEEKIDVVHQYSPGYPMQTPLYKALRLMGDRRPRLIETNIFGLLEDEEGENWVDFYCFISRASAAQALRRRWLPANEAIVANKTVVGFPLASWVEDAAARRATARRDLGLQPGEILILRLGRAGKKWNRDEVRIFQQARRHNRSLRLLLMEPPADIWREIESGLYGDGILLRPILADFDRLTSIYAAGDLMLHMSDWGESYGYTIAEAMQAGLPLVTRTTPWGDNAQVELVDQGATGFVCTSREGGTACLLRLAADARLRAEMGAAGKIRIEAMSNLACETDLLEEVLLHVVRQAPLQKVPERSRELLRFCAAFPQLERKVAEREIPGLKLAGCKGGFAGRLREMKAALGILLRRWRLRRR